MAQKSAVLKTEASFREDLNFLCPCRESNHDSTDAQPMWPCIAVLPIHYADLLLTSAGVQASLSKMMEKFSPSPCTIIMSSHVTVNERVDIASLNSRGPEDVT